LTSGDKNFNDFPENQPAKFHTLSSIQANRDQNFLPSPGCLRPWD